MRGRKIHLRSPPLIRTRTSRPAALCSHKTGNSLASTRGLPELQGFLGSCRSPAGRDALAKDEEGARGYRRCASFNERAEGSADRRPSVDDIIDNGDPLARSSVATEAGRR